MGVDGQHARMNGRGFSLEGGFTGRGRRIREEDDSK